MPLTAGSRVGPYEILTAIGAGGMGEVYAARDTRLNRTVAIKVLPSDVAGNPDLRSRFEREARAVAALDHPHICGIYDVGSVDGTHYLVMPHLEGQTLAARLEKGPLPLDQALKIAAEIADALDKAHRQGIVHRDIKPGNIMLTRSGSKLLDFGLAKLTAPAGPISMSSMTQMATAAPATAHGLILGTVQYMAPEQVEGKEADARSDIWALGTVLYEMVTGTRPFGGNTPASVISAILKDDAPLISVSQPLAPRTLEHLVSTCLAKEPDQRWQSAADVASMLSWIARTPHDITASGAMRHRPRAMAGWMVAGVLLIALLGVVLARSRRIESPAIPREPIVFNIYPPAGRAFAGGGASVPVPQLAVSPDGRHVVFVAAEPQGQPFLWLRTLGEKESRRLPGTEGAEAPFWAPDSRMVGFFAQGALKKADISGSASPETIGPVTTDMRGGAWSPSGVVVYSHPGNGLLRISPTDADPTPVNLKGSDVSFETARWPSFLPDGDRFLFLVRDNPERRGVYVGSLAASIPRRLAGNDWAAQYASGHLLLLRGSTLMAQPFDAITGTVTDSQTTVVEQVAGSSAGYGSFSVSATGVLAYSSGFLPPTDLRWVDRNGRATASVGAPAGDYVDLRLSPEESRLAFSRTDPRNQAPDVWVRDLARGTEARVGSDLLTDSSPLWSPSGDRLIFRSNRANGVVELFQMPPTAGAEAVTVYGTEQERTAHGTVPTNLFPTDWSPDGRFIIYHMSLGATGSDIWALSLVGERKAIPIARAQHNEVQGYVSPDSRWLAYASDESGRYEIYVQSFPDAGTGGKITISSGGGTQPRWSRNGRELFYLRADGTLMAVAVKTQPIFEPMMATPLFKTPLPTTMNAYRMDYVPSADGQRFLMKVPVENTPPPSITVVLNWPSLIKR